MINPESPPPPVEQEVKDARRTHTLRRTTTTPRLHPHHRPLVGTTTCSRRQIGGPDHAGLCWPLQANNNSAPQPVMSRPPDTGSQARGRLRIRARAILDCMCCDVPQSTPHTTAGNACRWARRCRLVMESLTHKTADPSPSTRTTTACAPPASRIFVDIDSIGFPLVRRCITCGGNPAS